MTREERRYSLRSATADDAPLIAALVASAYAHYVERIGRLPGPMTQDYPEVIRILGGVALFASTTNIVSGFLITDRMLKMFKKQ